jgi:intracellular multiplication protein IcmJ
MDGIPIKLGIARALPSAGGAKKKKSGAGSPGSASSSSKISLDLKQKILQRDDNTCKCCGFKSQKYQEILLLNSDASDTSEKNLATACMFCHQCFNLDQVSQMRSGVLIWLPEVDQAKLHHIARAIYVARISQGAMAEAARKALDALMARREEVKKRITTDDPYILASVLSDYLGAKHYEMRDKKLEGVRLFPLDRRIIKEADLEFNQFPQILAYWRSKDGPFGGHTPQDWIGIYQSLNKAA